MALDDFNRNVRHDLAIISNERHFIIPLNLLPLLICFLAVVSIGWGQTSAPAAAPVSLPPRAEAVVKKGLSAAEQQQWTVAISYFNEALQAAPDSPVPLVNLGLAEAQVPGHELRAICWFEAYLALVPNAANALAVRKQISDLELRAKGNADKIIEILKVLAGQIPSGERYWGFQDIAGLLARAGDLDAAQQIMQNQSDEGIQAHAREEIASGLAKANRIPDAVKEADQITDGFQKGDAYESIASAQIAAGLFSDAEKSIGQLSGYQQIAERLALADAEYHAGQKDDAAAILRDIRASIDKESSLDTRENWLARLAAGEYKVGMREEADALFKQVKKYAYGVTGKDKDSHRMYTLLL